MQWTVRSHSSVPYALDEPIQSAGLVLTAPGGVTATYDLNILGEGRVLTYENFIYIAFTGKLYFSVRYIYIFVLYIYFIIFLKQEPLKMIVIWEQEKVV